MVKDNFKKIKLILWTILLANILVAVLKIIIGSLIQSASMTADGYHSLTDGSSNIIGLIGIRFASMPEDEDHPYGHKKFETLAGMAIAGMLIFMGIKIISDAIQRFRTPVKPEITIESLLVLIFTLGFNIFISRYESLQGKKLGSDILTSDAAHTKSDIYITIAVLFTLIGVKLGLPPVIDSIASLAVSGFILHAAYGILSSTSLVLLDSAVIDSAKIRSIVMSFSQVKDCHKIRSRGRRDDIHIDLHVMLEPHVNVEESHNLIHSIENRINEELKQQVQVIVHIEPFYETVS